MVGAVCTNDMAPNVEFSDARVALAHAAAAHWKLYTMQSVYDIFMDIKLKNINTNSYLNIVLVWVRLWCNLYASNSKDSHFFVCLCYGLTLSINWWSKFIVYCVWETNVFFFFTFWSILSFKCTNCSVCCFFLVRQWDPKDDCIEFHHEFYLKLSIFNRFSGWVLYVFLHRFVERGKYLIYISSDECHGDRLYIPMYAADIQMSADALISVRMKLDIE